MITNSLCSLGGTPVQGPSRGTSRGTALAPAGRAARQVPRWPRIKVPSRAGQGPVRAFFRSGLGGARPLLIMPQAAFFASPCKQNFFRLA